MTYAVTVVATDSPDEERILFQNTYDDVQDALDYAEVWLTEGMTGDDLRVELREADA